ncbi:MAG: hypothetical protein LBP56_07560 [Odoribacteraceae bacterium]|jgi:hypothetical protein|nr:hypothetical protein [Odoribacteraceae bacterium]
MSEGLTKKKKGAVARGAWRVALGVAGVLCHGAGSLLYVISGITRGVAFLLMGYRRQARREFREVFDLRFHP